MKAIPNYLLNIGFFLLTLFHSLFSVGQTYNRDAAAAYADLWSCPENDPNKHNPAYSNIPFNAGNDCAYFVSQCLREGGLVLSAGPGLDQYGTGCIPECNNLHINLTKYQNAIYERRTIGYPTWFDKGDVVQFGNKGYSGDYWEHAAINVLSGTPALDAHTNNRCHQSVSFYYPGASPKYLSADFYHIQSINTQVPLNDNCSNAKSLAIGITYSNETLGGATTSLSENYCGSTSSTQIKDVWYKFIATYASHTITATPSSGLDIVIDLRQGSCNGSKLDCKDKGGGKGKAEILTYNNFVVGNTYYVRIYQDGILSTNDFSISVSSASSSLPDLKITPGSQTVSSTTMTAGTNITASCSEDNVGDASAGTNYVTLWLSSDNILDESTDVKLGQILFGPVAAQSCSSILNTSAQIPSNTSPGNYYLFFWADGNKVITESSDGNNSASIQISVTSTSSSATASITNLTISPSTVNTNSSFSLNYSISATGSLNVLLGASIRRNGQDYSDMSNDIAVPLVLGANSKSRSYNLSIATPNPVPFGDYDVLVALWKDTNSDGKINSGDIMIGNIFQCSQKLTVTATCIEPSITLQPSNQNKTASESASFSVTASGSSNLYQWQYNIGGGWMNIPNSSPYSGVTTSILNISSVSNSMDGYQYRCNVTSSCSVISRTSNSAILSVSTTCTAPVSPTSVTATQTTISSGQSTTLQVNGGTLNSAQNWVWYTGGCGGTFVGTGTTLPVTPITTTTYFVQASACGVTTACRQVTINVNSNSSTLSAPASFSALIGNPANGYEHVISLSCDAVAGVDGYSFEYSYDGKDWVQNWLQKPFNSIGISLADSPNFPIYCRVRSYKNSPIKYSDYTYAIPQPIYTACDEPAAPFVTKGKLPKTIDLILKPEYPVENPFYTLYSIYCASTNQYVQADGALGSAEVFQTKNMWGTKTISGLSNNKEYCFYAKAKNDNGDIRYNAWNIGCYTVYQPPIADFSYSTTNECDPLTISFADKSEGDIVAWNWDMNFDGQIDYKSKNPVHTFSTFGSHYVDLTIMNDVGWTSYTSKNIYISSQAVTPFIPVANPATNMFQKNFAANWSEVANVTGYRLDVSTDISFSTFVPDFKDRDIGKVTFYNVFGLIPNTTYYYRVRAYNKCGSSLYSNVIIGTTLPNPPSIPVANSALAIAQTSFTANWGQSTNALGYYLDVSSDPSFGSFLNGFENKSLGSVKSYNITGLTANTQYYYRLRAYNTGGTSQNSNIISVITLPNPPAIPDVVPGSEIVQTSFTANWNQSPTATGYLLDVSTNSNFSSPLPGFQSKDVGNELKYAVTGLNARTPYYYRVRAYNTGGVSGYSYVMSVMTLTNPPPPPTSLTAVSCNNLVTLKWIISADPNVNHYRIFGGTMINPITKIDSTKGTSPDNTIVIPGLKEGQQYYFRLIAVNFDGPASPFSTQVSVIVKTGVIPKISIKWNKLLICSNIDNLITDYRWYFNNSLIPNAVLQYLDVTNNAGVYYVSTTDKEGCKNPSNKITVSNYKSLVVYPNPASTTFQLKLLNSPDDQADVSVLNSAGICILKFKAENVKDELLKAISVRNLEDGVYVIQVKMGNGELYNTKVVVKK